jgi:hypothetical protein
MKLKNPLRLALLLALVPAPGIAGPAASNYEKFELTKAEIAAVATATAAKCPKNAGGPKFQASCRAKLMVQSDARLNASYKRTMARLSKPAANPRPDAAVAIEYNDCALVELKRRTLWLDRYK